MQSSPPSPKVEKPVPAPAPIVKAEEEEVDDNEFYEDGEEKKTQLQDDKMTPEDKVALDMELLQNNGRFRAELLYQLQELNKALSVIAQILAK